jgi:hypothetical protein
MIPTITAFERSPDRGRGLERDMRVRWGLEEVGQPYDVRLLSFSEMKESAHRCSWRRHHPLPVNPNLGGRWLIRGSQLHASRSSRSCAQ